VQTPEPQQRDRTSTATSDPGAAGSADLAETPTPVEVRVHADPALIPSVRAVAADLAARADFDLDAVSDLRMAVDEACSALVPLAREGGQLRCGFVMSEGRIDVICRVPVRHEATLRQDTFGWRVLTTLTDDAEVLDADPEWLGIHLRKQRLNP
jgi:serine/threonine-protein kinase RsbW